MKTVIRRIETVNCDNSFANIICVSKVSDIWAPTHVKNFQTKDITSHYALSWDGSSDHGSNSKIRYEIVQILSKNWAKQKSINFIEETEFLLPKKNDVLVCPPFMPMNIFIDLSELYLNDHIAKENFQDFHENYFNVTIPPKTMRSQERYSTKFYCKRNARAC